MVWAPLFALAGLALASPAAATLEPFLAPALDRAGDELAQVFPREPWELFCRVRWADTSSAAKDSLWSMIEPCDEGTTVAPGFDPMTAYVRISGDSQNMDAELRTTGLRGCWKLTDEALKAAAKKRPGPPPAAVNVILGHRMGAAQMVKRGVQSFQWVRRILVTAGAKPERFSHAGKGLHGPLYRAQIDDLGYILVFDEQSHVRWIQLGTKKRGTQIDLRPTQEGLLPERFRFQGPEGLVWFEWKFGLVGGRWLPKEMAVGSPKARAFRVLLEDCALGESAEERRAQWDNAKPLGDP